MRRPLIIDCAGSALAGFIHPAGGEIGVVIVAGGLQTRVGSHRGFVELADKLAMAGYPALRFDRRGLGDSDGIDMGFRASAPDIAAAVRSLRSAMPAVRHVIGWGLCDGASALALHASDIDGLDGLILVNPWVLDVERVADLPPRAAIAARYRARLRDPHAWLRLLRHGLDVRRAGRGLLRLMRPEPMTQLARAMAEGLARFDGPLLLLLSERDTTASSFSAAWKTAVFRDVRRRGDVETRTVAGADHTFTCLDDAHALAGACFDWLTRRG